MECILYDTEPLLSLFFFPPSFRSSLSAVFLLFLVEHLGLRSQILIHYCSQRDTRASAGVHSTPVPSVKKEMSILFKTTA